MPLQVNDHKNFNGQAAEQPINTDVWNNLLTQNNKKAIVTSDNVNYTAIKENEYYPSVNKFYNFEGDALH